MKQDRITKALHLAASYREQIRGIPHLLMEVDDQYVEFDIACRTKPEFWKVASIFNCHPPTTNHEIYKRWDLLSVHGYYITPKEMALADEAFFQD